jgi:hypothetical protein
MIIYTKHAKEKFKILKNQEFPIKKKLVKEH